MANRPSYYISGETISIETDDDNAVLLKTFDKHGYITGLFSRPLSYPTFNGYDTGDAEEIKLIFLLNDKTIYEFNIPKADSELYNSYYLNSDLSDTNINRDRSGNPRIPIKSGDNVKILIRYVNSDGEDQELPFGANAKATMGLTIMYDQ